MRTLFRLQFRIVSGADARTENPFAGPESDLAIVSIDTLAAERMFGRLREAATEPYDLVVFDEAHKLFANREPDFRVRKTDRYRLAEALAGAGADSDRWTLHWSARHLLLTATPHMGKDYPYYFLWRLLTPDTLSTYDAFAEFPHEARKKHFIRRTKEEMVRFDGTPLYPQRTCDTLSYDLSQGSASEQALYDETTDYIRDYYNRARVLNRSAARLAMSVFQRRLASSTYAVLRSFERRKEKLEGLIDDIRNGRLTEERLARGSDPGHRGQGKGRRWRGRGFGERMGQGMQPSGWLLALCRLRLRHAPAPPGQGPRPVRPAPGHGEGERRHRQLRGPVRSYG